MKRLIVIVEGQTEQEFVQGLLAEEFLKKGIMCLPRPVVTSLDVRHGQKHTGGIVNYQKVRQDIVKTIKSDNGPDVFYTTMFDYYGRIKDFPGYDEATRLMNYEAVAKLEKSLLEDIKMALPDFDVQRCFIPNFLCHEFEAILMTDITKLSSYYFDAETEVKKLAAEIAEIGNPEFVNTSEETAPSKRILRAVPDYDKVVCGTVVALEIGLDRIISSCAHFRSWLERLNAIV